VLQLTAFGGRNDDLFHAIAAESPAFPPIRNVSENQFSYDALLKKAGCSDLQCLRDLDAVEFQKAVRNLDIAFPGGNAVPIYFWNPTLDDDFIKDYTYNEIKAGHFVRVPSIFGDTTNEGWVFTPKTITSQQRATQFVTNQFVNLDKQEQKRIKATWRGPPDIARDARWRNVASDIYGHIRYTCGTLNISAAYARNSNTSIHQYRWNVGSAYHVGEIGSIWNNGTSASGAFMQGYIASFIRSYDPNKYKAIYKSGSINMTAPTWDQYGTGVGRRMMFNDNNDVEMQDVSDADRTKCDLITSMGVQLQQ
jgi:carboxylesterase type B